MGVTITSSNKFPRKAWAGLALGSALLFGASWLWLNQDFPLPGQAKSGVIVPALEVEAGTVEVILSESGSVELGSQKVLLAPREATVDEVLVQVNDRVKLNQPLIRLRFTTNQTSLEEEELKVHQKELSIEQERQAIEQQQLALTEAEANLAKTRMDEVRLQTAVDDRQIDLEESEQRLTTTQNLLDRGLIPADELQREKQSVRQATSALREAEDQVKKLRIDQNTQRASLEQATANLRLKQLSLQNALLELELQRLQAQKLAQQLRNNTIISPFDGQILSLEVGAGDGVEVSKSLLTIGDPAQKWVKLRLPPLNAAKVKVGQLARVMVAGSTEKPAIGEIISVSPLANEPSNNSGNVGNSFTSGPTVPVLIQMKEGRENFVPGSLVQVEIILEQRENTVQIPLEARQEGDFVWIVDDQNRAQERSITPGLEGLSNVEVVNGLKVGEVILLPSPDLNLSPNRSVQVQL